MKNLILVLLVSFSLNVSGQGKVKIHDSDYSNDNVEMADGLRQEGKIYVLTGVILIILSGTIGYLIVIDRKVGALEKGIKK